MRFLINNINIFRYKSEFAVKSWISRFIERNGISYRRATSVGTNSYYNPDSVRTAKRCIKEIRKLIKKYKITADRIINFDETAVTLNVLSHYSYDFKGTRKSMSVFAGKKRQGFLFVSQLQPMGIS